jgi:RNA polymerase sigma factor (sigma-70 family)
VQEGWCIAMSAFRTYDEDKGYALKSWIIQHLRRDMVRFLENERKHRASFHDILIDDILDEDGYDELTDFEAEGRVQDQVDLHHLLEKLPEREANVVEMFYLGDMSETEIADILGLSRSMVQKVRNSAVAKIQQLAGYQLF